jgi:hypothetical protein
MTTALEVAQGIMEEAIGRALNVSEKGAIATKWYVIIEFMGASGEKTLFRFGDESSAVWEHGGIVGYAAEHLEDENG